MKTVVVPSYEGATLCIDPADARYGAPSFPFGAELAAACSASERRYTGNLASYHFLVTGSSRTGQGARLRDRCSRKKMKSPAPTMMPAPANVSALMTSPKKT